MTRINHYYPGVEEIYEYHGNTSVQRIRRFRGRREMRDWILFDSVKEAQAWFNEIIDPLEARRPV